MMQILLSRKRNLLVITVRREAKGNQDFEGATTFIAPSNLLQRHDLVVRNPKPMLVICTAVVLYTVICKNGEGRTSSGSMAMATRTPRGERSWGWDWNEVVDDAGMHVDVTVDVIATDVGGDED